MLKKGDGHEANYIYINESADWAKYSKIYIKNIDLWKSEDKGSPLNKLSTEDQQMLVNFVHTAVANAVEKNFQVVDQPGRTRW